MPPGIGFKIKQGSALHSAEREKAAPAWRKDMEQPLDLSNRQEFASLAVLVAR